MIIYNIDPLAFCMEVKVLSKFTDYMHYMYHLRSFYQTPKYLIKGVESVSFDVISIEGDLMRNFQKPRL